MDSFKESIFLISQSELLEAHMPIFLKHHARAVLIFYGKSCHFLWEAVHNLLFASQQWYCTVAKLCNLMKRHVYYLARHEWTLYPRCYNKTFCSPWRLRDSLDFYRMSAWNINEQFVNHLVLRSNVINNCTCGFDVFVWKRLRDAF